MFDVSDDVILLCQFGYGIPLLCLCISLATVPTINQSLYTREIRHILCSYNGSVSVLYLLSTLSIKFCYMQFDWLPFQAIQQFIRDTDYLYESLMVLTIYVFFYHLVVGTTPTLYRLTGMLWPTQKRKVWGHFFLTIHLPQILLPLVILGFTYLLVARDMEHGEYDRVFTKVFYVCSSQSVFWCLTNYSCNMATSALIVRRGREHGIRDPEARCAEFLPFIRSNCVLVTMLGAAVPLTFLSFTSPLNISQHIRFLSFGIDLYCLTFPPTHISFSKDARVAILRLWGCARSRQPTGTLPVTHTVPTNHNITMSARHAKESTSASPQLIIVTL